MPPKKRGRKNADNGAAKKRRPKKAPSSSDSFDSGSDHEEGNGTQANNQHLNDGHPDNDAASKIDDSGDNVALHPQVPTLTGRLLVCGGTNWDMIGRKELPKAAKGGNIAQGKNLWSPHTTKWKVKFLSSSCTACHSVIITEDGKVMSWGRNDKGMLSDCLCLVFQGS